MDNFVHEIISTSINFKYDIQFSPTKTLIFLALMMSFLMIFTILKTIFSFQTSLNVLPMFPNVPWFKNI
jgi:hypothetical protein